MVVDPIVMVKVFRLDLLLELTPVAESEPEPWPAPLRAPRTDLIQYPSPAWA
jgi:hypothetical protein